jgi:hypothetical protein
VARGKPIERVVPRSDPLRENRRAISGAPSGLFFQTGMVQRTLICMTTTRLGRILEKGAAQEKGLRARWTQRYSTAAQAPRDTPAIE